MNKKGSKLKTQKTSHLKFFFFPSVRGHAPPKLSKRFFGPFKVLRRIGEVAYELDLPPDAKIHPVFHVSKLKPFHGEPPSQIPSLDPYVTGTLVNLWPSAILGSRTLKTAGADKRQVLVQWEGLPSLEAMWEDALSLAQSYPHLNLEDKVSSEEGGNDTGVHSTNGAVANNGLGTDNGLNRSRAQREKKTPKWLEDFV